MKEISVKPEDFNKPVSKADKSVSWRARRENPENINPENIKHLVKN